MNIGSHTCSNCGNWIFDTEYSCPYCGQLQPINQASQYGQPVYQNNYACQSTTDTLNEVTNEQHISASTNGQVNRKKGRTGRITCSIILIGALVFVILLGVFIKKAYSEIMPLNEDVSVTSDLIDSIGSEENYIP